MRWKSPRPTLLKQAAFCLAAIESQRYSQNVVCKSLLLRVAWDPKASEIGQKY
jgi:hypothetical protein